MAIDIQPPNLNGLTAIAGKSAPLNLQPTGALGLQALQQQQTNDASLRANALAHQQLQQQGQLGLLSNQTQNRALDLQTQQQQNQGVLAQANLGLDQQKLAQQGSQFSSDLTLKQQQMALQQKQDQDQLDLKNRILAETTAKDQMAKTLALSKEELQNQGAFASYGLISMKGAKTPEEANTIRAEINKEAVSKGYLTQAQADTANTLPISQYTNGLAYQVMAKGQAKVYRDMVDASKPPANASGLTQVFDPQSGKLVYSSIADKPVQAQAQKDVMGANDNLQELNNLYKNVPPNYFGVSALGQTYTYLKELGQSIPGVGKILEPSLDSKDDLKKYSGLQGAQEMMAMNVIKQLSGVQYSDKQLEFMKKILPEFGPTSVQSVFNGRVENLQRFFEQTKVARDQVLKDGFKVSNDPDSPYAKALMSKIQDSAVTTDPNSGLRAHLKQLGHSDQEINDYLKTKGQ